jgi:rubredoxin
MREQPTDLCQHCGATRWEHSKEQWIYCHLPVSYKEQLTDAGNSLTVESEGSHDH